MRFRLLTLCLPVALSVMPVLASAVDIHTNVFVTSQYGSEIDFPNSSIGLWQTYSDKIFNEYLGGLSEGGQFQIYDGMAPILATVDMEIIGRRGGSLCLETKLVADERAPQQYSEIVLQEGVLGGSGNATETFESDPLCDNNRLVQDLKQPVICPRFASQRYFHGQLQLDESCGSPLFLVTPDADYINMNADLAPSGEKNHNPPRESLPQDLTDTYDCKNVLRINEVSLSFDWEGGDLVTGWIPEERIKETLGGVYSNLHYVVVPCSPTYNTHYQTFLSTVQPITHPDFPTGDLARGANELNVCGTCADPANRTPACSAGSPNCCHTRNPCQDQTMKQGQQSMQYLLHLANSFDTNFDLAKIGEQNPPLLTHALLSGGFWTKNDAYWGDQCEWLDTRSQAPQQTVRYANLGVWDWDWTLNGAPVECVNLLVYEGDGNPALPRLAGQIGPNDLTNDLIGFFEIQKSALRDGPTTLTNFSGDFQIKVSIGNTECELPKTCY